MEKPWKNQQLTWMTPLGALGMFLQFHKPMAFRYYANQILEFDKKRTTAVDVGNSSFQGSVTYEPMGVAGLIVPWNYPLLMAAWKVN
jgi:hypothetical protein